MTSLFIGLSWSGRVEGPFTRVTRRFLRKLSRDNDVPIYQRRSASLSSGSGPRMHAHAHAYACTGNDLEDDGPTGEYLQEVKQKEIPGGPLNILNRLNNRRLPSSFPAGSKRVCTHTHKYSHTSASSYRQNHSPGSFFSYSNAAIDASMNNTQ